MYAKVIVDVPAKRIDRPFDYRIPKSLQDWVQVGSRVEVAFAGRIVQGFVVDLQEDSGVESDKLKEIRTVLDLTPPLNRELVQLAHWMSGEYVCSKISALQAMIPAAMKAKAERRVALAQESQEQFWSVYGPQQQELIAWIREKGSVSLDKLLARFPDEAHCVKEWMGSGFLTEVKVLKSRVTRKTVLTVHPPQQKEKIRDSLTRLSANSRRQREVLEYLLEHSDPVPLSRLIARLKLSSATVKALADKGWIELREEEVYRDPYADRNFAATEPLPLTEEQEKAKHAIVSALSDQRHQTFLLFGVTGSGKTEVYLQTIERCLRMDREAIVLVPEISLTPQMVERFKGRFGDLVAVLHSRLSQGERYDEWRKIAEKRVKVAIGARSAIFAPFVSIGLIIIDEEHESSYKQEESPKYHARDVALARGRSHNAVVVLGSATPSLESYFLAGAGEFEFLTMMSRVEGRPLPAVHIVDLRLELKEGNRSMFSRALRQAVQQRLEKEEQSIVLLNRRGHSTFVMCRSCGFTAQCPHCDITLTYHLHSRMLRCHYCGYAERESAVCPSCGSEHIRYFGTGTQRVEEELVKLFPGIRVIRMDMDTTSEKGAHEKLLNRFKNRQADVLLGTQMVAKGLDFPAVTLVGVIAADTVLHLPDFRAAEKTFQLLTQVAGRAGRHHLPGEVYIQTYAPEHYSVVCASRHDYRGFVQTEMHTRKDRGYPPYCRLILLTLSHEQLPVLVNAGEELAAKLKQLRDRRGLSADAKSSVFMDVLGPVASPIPRLKDRYRFQCMVKYRGEAEVCEMTAQAVSEVEQLSKYENLQISVDVNPYLLM